MYYRRLSKRGGSLALTIPSELLRLMKIGLRDTVAIYAADRDTIIVKKVDPFGRRTTNGQEGSTAPDPIDENKL